MTSLFCFLVVLATIALIVAGAAITAMPVALYVFGVIVLVLSAGGIIFTLWFWR